MKAALKAWGADSNLFHQGTAKESTDPEIVAATMKKPGVVLKRPVGSDGPFGEHAELPKDFGKSGRKKPPSKPSARKPKSSSAKPDKAADKKAEQAYERERQRREREEAKEEAARKKERERRQQAVEKAQAALEQAEQEHVERAEVLRVELDAIEKKVRTEDSEWRKKKSG